MRRFTLCVLLSLLCLSSPAVLAEARSNQQLSELISRSRLLCASALLYFDPLQRNLDPRGLTAVYYHLNTLDSLVVQLGQPAALQAPLTALKGTFSRLDRLPPAERQRYPELLGQLLSQQRQLQEAAEAAAAGQGSHPLQLQSRDLARLLLDYQMRHYHWPQPRTDLLAVEQREQLDQAIGQRFSQLEQAQPEQADALKAIRRHYQFVRKQLHSPSQGAGGGAEFYLSRAVLDLDELAASQP
ncbi:hypothetical protein F3I16_19940 [Pseudomonas sp. L-22-4S-12]|uniref:hypothetical protein n=1 Tax=Pseudomonas sp. L-22-4S-12 TaxID=2610893 RepID=UPI0013293023|nr:hypothetical protein [Pseudomonas sp. L-22-4S-12]MWV18316.1 hypothetical protein [Pseudomonas sp. L-22-4S-12]